MDRREIRKQRRQDQVREEILDAARSVLLSRGLPGLTLAAVARELQLTKAALYYYFPSKEALSFELVYAGLDSHSEVVGNAVSAATSGADAIEALIRTSANHYGAHMDQLRLAYMMPQVGAASSTGFGPEMIARIRPFNERMYGATGDKIHQDQQLGLVPSSVDGRRLAFLAHLSVLGMLMIEGVVDVVDESPLIHARQAMVDELVAVYTARLGHTGPPQLS